MASPSPLAPRGNGCNLSSLRASWRRSPFHVTQRGSSSPGVSANLSESPLGEMVLDVSFICLMHFLEFSLVLKEHLLTLPPTNIRHLDLLHSFGWLDWIWATARTPPNHRSKPPTNLRESDRVLRAASPFFPAILLSRKSPKTLGKQLVFEKNDG